MLHNRMPSNKEIIKSGGCSQPGIRFMNIGVLLALVSVFFYWLGFSRMGMGVFWGGWVVGVIGFIIHARSVFSLIKKQK